MIVYGEEDLVERDENNVRWENVQIGMEIERVRDLDSRTGAT